MATTRSFNDMLNEYLPNDLLKEELIKRDWFLQKVKKDNSWKGGKLIVPFEGTSASSVSFGSLTASDDIAEDDFVRGSVDDYKEMWGTMKFNHRDILDHSGRVNEDSFLKILPNRVENFMQYQKEVLSIHLLNGYHFAEVKADSGPADASSGILEVTNIDRFMIGQKVTLDDGNSNEAEYYVTAVNLNNETITLSSTRGGSAADVSAYTSDQAGKFYHPGVWDSNAVSTGFTSVAGTLLTSGNGGLSSLYGQTKTAYPFLQAINVDGSSIDDTNLLEKLFDAYTTVRSRARGNADTFLMSYKHLGTIMKLIELQKGAFKVSAGQTKASQYGWTEIELTTVKGTLKVVGIQEMSDSMIHILDMSTWTLYSNGFFRKRQAPDGREYFEVRATTGYSYIVDISFFGELICHAPTKNGIIHSISY